MRRTPTLITAVATVTVLLAPIGPVGAAPASPARPATAIPAVVTASAPAAPSFRMVFVPRRRTHFTNPACGSNSWSRTGAVIALASARRLAGTGLDVSVKAPHKPWSSTTLANGAYYWILKGDPRGTFYDSISVHRAGTWKVRIRVHSHDNGPVVDGDAVPVDTIGTWSSVHSVKVTHRALARTLTVRDARLDNCMP